MKIDLHIHIASGSGRTEIAPVELIRMLDNKDVRLASVTEHNFFEEATYDLLKKNEKQIFFIPGIELDVITKWGRKHVIIYSEDVALIKGFSTGNYIEADSFYEKLKNSNQAVLISPHFQKDPKTSFVEIANVRDFFAPLTSNFRMKFMLEFPKKQNIYDIRGTLKMEYHAAWFSDVKNWNEYENVELFETNLKITSLSKYISVFVKQRAQMDTNADNDLENYKFVNSWNVSEKLNKEELFDIDLSINSLNIVFGGKGSGKTNFIDSFYEHVKGKKEWKKIIFSDGIIKENEGDLYKYFKREELFNDSSVYFDNLLLKFEEPIHPDLFSATEIKVNSKETFNDFELYNSKKLSEKLKKEIKFIGQPLIDIKTLIKKRNEIFAKISRAFEIILKELSSKTYEGSLSKQTLLQLYFKNAEDWLSLQAANVYNIVKFFEKEIDVKFKSRSVPPIGLKNYIDQLEKNSTLNSAFFEKTLSLLKEKGEILKSEILENGVYTFSWNVEARTSQSRKEKELFTKSKFNDVEISQFVSVFKELDVAKFLDFFINYDRNSSDFKVKDLINVVFISEESANPGKRFLPSTGQLDMLKLDFKLSKNFNLVIDEFCDSLDNQYVFQKIVPRLKTYNRMIVAATHNPIISVLCDARTYIYKKKSYGKYLTYVSNDSFDAPLECLNDTSEKPMETKTALLNTIDGTTEAFKKRGEIYGV